MANRQVIRYPPRPVDPEAQIRTLLGAGDLQGAATKTLEAFGLDVLGFLGAVLREEQDAHDVFSQACEDLWQSIARFEGRPPIRLWFYTLARHALARWRRSPHRRPAHKGTLSSEAHHKRFQLVKEAMRVRAREAGLLGDD
jgi:DNA-directed RNA polymerase specialized sigma24 family protein